MTANNLLTYLGLLTCDNIRNFVGRFKSQKRTLLICYFCTFTRNTDIIVSQIV